MSFNITTHSMTTLDHANHSIRRKSYAPHYTQSSVSQFQPEMQEYTFDLINVRNIVYEPLRIYLTRLNCRALKASAERLQSNAWHFSDT
jgi:cytochrome P450